MLYLQYPLQGSSKATLGLRSHPSLAQNLVARLEDLPERPAFCRPSYGSESACLKSTSQPDQSVK
jgi:hypothetical protein